MKALLRVMCAGGAALMAAMMISCGGGGNEGQVKQAVHDEGLFELDGNAMTDGDATNGIDWQTLYTGGVATYPTFTGIIRDVAPAAPTQFTGGGSKDDLDVTQWLWKADEPLDKDDITDAYAWFTVKNGDPFVYFGLDRFATDGTAQIGFWFFQDPVGLTNTKKQGGFMFSGQHRVGDVLVQSNFTGGGKVENITVFKWVGSGGSHGSLDKLFPPPPLPGSPPTTVDCRDPLLGGGDPVCAAVNGGAVPSPWSYQAKNYANANEFPPNAFFEGGINLRALNLTGECFSSFIGETRSSAPFNAVLKDFALGSIESCGITVDKTGDTLSKVGDTVDYTITITNTGVITLYKDDISDNVLGVITANGVDAVNANVVTNTCGPSLAAGASCTITLSRVTQAGDPNPLVNQVDISYNSHADFTGDAVTASDTHSVTLFAPSVSIAKTGDTLSKVGDTVNYTITVTNTSSAGTPAMNCTVSDTLLGAIGTINGFAVGAAPVVYTPSRVTQVGDPDPLLNTATVTCSIPGYTNAIDSASASHSVNLFQPSVSISKTGDAYTKAGDTVNYTITVTNTSSADTPAMDCTVSDTLLGALAPITGFTSASAPVVYTPSRVTLAGDPDPLDNTATVTCSISGYTNSITDSASHSVDVLHPAFTVAKACISTEPVAASGPANFQVTFSNTGDADLVFTSSECGTITVAAGGSDSSCTPSVPGPLTPPSVSNTDTGTVALDAKYGLPNSFEFSASASCDVQQTFQGCTPGYWKNHTSAWPSPYTTGTLLGSVFTNTDPYAGSTFLEALGFQGGDDLAGKKQILLRAAVAALLSAADPNVDYALTTAQIIAQVNAALATGDGATIIALATQLNTYNNLNCPLN